MAAVVADTSPLIALHQIGHLPRTGAASDVTYVAFLGACESDVTTSSDKSRNRAGTPHPEQLAGLIMREFRRPVAFNRERFQRLSARVGMSGNVVRKIDDDLHTVKNE